MAYVTSVVSVLSPAYAILFPALFLPSNVIDPRISPLKGDVVLRYISSAGHSVVAVPLDDSSNIEVLPALSNNFNVSLV